jgi:hypothetical protein
LNTDRSTSPQIYSDLNMPLIIVLKFQTDCSNKTIKIAWKPFSCHVV